MEFESAQRRFSAQVADGTMNGLLSEEAHDYALDGNAQSGGGWRSHRVIGEALFARAIKNSVIERRSRALTARLRSRAARVILLPCLKWDQPQESSAIAATMPSCLTF
jgi:hypothetical protein